VGDLESLEAIATFGFLSDDIEDGVNEFSTFSVMTLGPVVTSTGLTKDEVVWAEELTEGTSTDSVHGTWFEIDEDSARDELVARRLIEVDVHALELQIGGSIVHSGAVKTVLARDSLPEGSTDLVTALAGLEMDDFTHAG
jgi:hypothetical protein